MKTIRIKGKTVGAEKPCFIIAEAGSNHDGSLAQAKRLIEVAAESGADAIKFQLFKAEDLYPENCGKVDTPAGKIDLFKALKGMELPADWLKTLKKYSEGSGLVFICSPFSERSALALNKLGIGAFKIASPEITHIPLLEYISRFRKPLIISTGMSKLRDVEEALDACYSQNNREIVLMHCITAYPAPNTDCNLKVIDTLQKAFDVPVGLSDHTLDPIVVPSISLLVGSAMLEKHFTVSKKLKGPDHPFAIEPNELKLMVKTIRNYESMEKNDRSRKIIKTFGESLVRTVLGSGVKRIAPSEKELYECDRRNIRAIRDIARSEKLTKKNIGILRAERNLKPGLHPRYFNLVIGKKAAKDIPCSKEIKWGDF